MQPFLPLDVLFTFASYPHHYHGCLKWQNVKLEPVTTAVVPQLFVHSCV